MTNDSGGAETAAAAPQRQESAMTWRERIVEARTRGKFTEDDELLAQSFCTCAVGEQYRKGVTFVVVAGAADENFGGAGSPEDKALDDLGMRFFGAVRSHSTDDAESLLDAIEDRALALKRETFGASSDDATPTA